MPRASDTRWVRDKVDIGVVEKDVSWPCRGSNPNSSFRRNVMIIWTPLLQFYFVQEPVALLHSCPRVRRIRSIQQETPNNSQANPSTANTVPPPLHNMVLQTAGLQRENGERDGPPQGVLYGGERPLNPYSTRTHIQLCSFLYKIKRK